MQVYPGTKIVLVGDGPYQMPDLTGWSMTEVLQFAQAIDAKLKLTGNGFVATQSPAAGSLVKNGMTITVTLNAKNPDTKTENKNKS
jgi:penicillin-binding protein 2B